MRPASCGSRGGRRRSSAPQPWAISVRPRATPAAEGAPTPCRKPPGRVRPGFVEQSMPAAPPDPAAAREMATARLSLAFALDSVAQGLTGLKTIDALLVLAI